MLEVDGRVVEDASWLRNKDEFSHINIAELESILEGVISENRLCVWIEIIIKKRIKGENKRSSRNDYKTKVGQST